MQPIPDLKSAVVEYVCHNMKKEDYLDEVAFRTKEGEFVVLVGRMQMQKPFSHMSLKELKDLSVSHTLIPGWQQEVDEAIKIRSGAK
jgi:hypothetical protein